DGLYFVFVVILPVFCHFCSLLILLIIYPILENGVSTFFIPHHFFNLITLSSVLVVASSLQRFYVLNYSTAVPHCQAENKVGKPLELPNPSIFEGLDNFAYQIQFDAVK
ncbi:hypothetical protein, partial [Anaerostipes caccae]|uniref:hypothetical protein n=1 Tax=Anaerostipes caccae TaxID=105841 RepID=UPI001A917EBD